MIRRCSAQRLICVFIVCVSPRKYARLGRRKVLDALDCYRNRCLSLSRGTTMRSSGFLLLNLVMASTLLTSQRASAAFCKEFYGLCIDNHFEFGRNGISLACSSRFPGRSCQMWMGTECRCLRNSGNILLQEGGDDLDNV